MKVLFRFIFLLTIVISTVLPAMENAPEQYIKTRGQKRRQMQQTAVIREKKQKEMNQVVHVAQKEKEKCPICWGNLTKNNQITLQCHANHKFHTNCLQSWRRRSALCPYGCPPVQVKAAIHHFVAVRNESWEKYLPYAVLMGSIFFSSLACSTGYIQCPGSNHTFI